MVISETKVGFLLWRGGRLGARSGKIDPTAGGRACGLSLAMSEKIENRLRGCARIREYPRKPCLIYD